MREYIAIPSVAALGQQHISPAISAAKVITRFAPSPNGYLHIGHALSAICAHDFARLHDGNFLLRIEDIDGTRSRIEHRQAIIADLKWLGLSWDGDVIYQSERVQQYQAALDRLREMGLVYRCDCSRSDIAAAIKSRPVPHGPDGPVYPGTCRNKHIADSKPASWRLDMKAALEIIAEPLRWNDLAAGMQDADAAIFGDIILWRKDAPASYHLAATLDDDTDGISHVVRGRDLFAYTSVHILLQKLLGLLQPVYWHHDLMTEKNGEKLGKSRGSSALAVRREANENGPKIASDLRQGKLPLGISLTTG